MLETDNALLSEHAQSIQILKKQSSVINEGDMNNQRMTMVDAWKQSDFLFRNYILNGLNDTLYKV